jgi:hypothetical protein
MSITSKGGELSLLRDWFNALAVVPLSPICMVSISTFKNCIFWQKVFFKALKLVFRKKSKKSKSQKKVDGPP